MTISTRLMAAFLLGGLPFSMGARADTRALVSDEQVPVQIRAGALQCRDAIPDHGYGAVPAGIGIDEASVSDRTLRLQGMQSLLVSLPDGVTCAGLREDLARVPPALTARRRLSRVTELTWDKKRSVTRLQGEITLEIPVAVQGKNLVLHGSQDWLETNLPAGGSASLPVNTSYDVLIHPQSGSRGVGLFCDPDFDGAVAQSLSVGDLGGDWLTTGGLANVTVARAPFADSASCESVRDDLLVRYAAEDPGNWGTPVRVTRSVESDVRYLLDNDGKPACQSIELETVSITLQGHRFEGAKSFPVSTVPLQTCFPERTPATGSASG